MFKISCFIVSLFVGSMLADAAASPSEADEGKIVRNRAPLQNNAFNPLPLGAIRPSGWLREQLLIQAEGLTGHLDEFWPDVSSTSGWLGGKGESWERGPYYLDGLLPLAYQLNDPTLKTKAKRWVEWTLTHQQPNGQIGPVSNQDWWPRMVMLKVLTQYEEVSGDPRVVPLMTKYFDFELKELPKHPLTSWGKYRWQDNAYTVFWLYNRTGNKNLITLAQLLHTQGFNWEAQFRRFRYIDKQSPAKLGLLPKGEPSDAAMQTHGVNNAMALKAAPEWWLLTGKGQDRGAFASQLATIDRYHGLPNGMFSSDEHFAGPDPSQGTELCTVVEAMFSLEQSFAILGDPRIADRTERIAYNALPATLTNDMWAHQYDQQPNQVACTRAKRAWSTNGDESNLFGLEPHFGCCTANYHQGWPKFASSLWMGTNDGGLMTFGYAPNQLHTKVGGVPVQIDEATLYPFDGKVRLTMHPSRQVMFPLLVRVPVWTKGAVITVGGKPAYIVKNHDGANDPSKLLYRINRTWKNGDVVEITFKMEPRVTHWYHQSAVFERGALVFALPVGAKWTELKKHKEQSADWQVTPTTAWNYGVAIGQCDAAVTQHTLTKTPFDVAHPAVTIQVQGKRVPEWTMANNSAATVPPSPVAPETETESLTLVPYGAAKLRITAFPYLKQPSQCQADAAEPPTGQ